MIGGDIPVGYRTESGSRGVPLKIGEKIPDGAQVELRVMRPGESTWYIPANVEVQGDTLYWLPDATDTEIEGRGYLQIWMRYGEKRKTIGRIMRTSVQKSVSGGQEMPPDPLVPYIERVVDAADRITGMSVTVETLPAGSDATAQWDGNKGVLHFGLPVGACSEDGAFDPSLLIDDTSSATNRTWSANKLTMLFGSVLHGSRTYSKMMSAYFQACDAEHTEDLTDIVESWYKLGRNGWTGGTRFDAPDKSTVSTGTKLGDNAGMVCEPSTNTVAGRDDYAKLPLFAVTDCNWELDANGKRRITAIKGIASAKPFVTDDPKRPVGVLQMAPWCKYEEDENGYEYWFTDQMRTAGFYPIPESVDLDGTIHSWVVHAKYGLGDAYSSIANVPIRVWDVSHNGQRTAIPKAFGANGRYCGKSSCDDAWMKLHVYIKYASLTLDGIMNGCCSYYNANKHPAVAETGVKRIIVTVAEGNALLVGSTICMGTGNYGGKAAQVSVVDRRKITSIEDIEIGGTAYKAVYLDVDATFDTTVDLIWTTMQWWTGSTDNVLGNDGSPYSNTSSKEPYKLQGIEQSYGCYEVMGDTILRYKKTDAGCVLAACVCRDATRIATNVTADYHETAYRVACPASSSWQYIKRLGFDSNLPECMFMSEIGGTSATHTRDAVYILANSTSAYEWLALGDLSNGLTLAGLSCAYASYGLGYAYWRIGGRLSANGSRGEWAA